jgi:aryl-alcohol dehydrogenase-like predicted oxidoreductase
MAAEKSLARCRAQKFDLLLLHNPDWTGYSSEAVWKGMDALKAAGLTDRLGIAPGPANGFTLDVIYSFENFGPLIDWAMLILNPLEPWPGSLPLPAAAKHDVKVITRVVDYGGLFHDDVKRGHKFLAQDHRVFRPTGWVEAGNQKLEQMRSVAKAHNLTLLQLACIWNLSQPAIKSVIPTFIQESGASKPIETKVEELASLPEVRLSDKELDFIATVGNNKGCMSLKGGNPEHQGEAVADRWPLSPALVQVGKRWQISEQDLV